MSDKKPNLLLLHGALGSADAFKGLSNLLGEKFNVHALTFSGYGNQPPKGSGFSIQQFTNDVLIYLENNQIEKTHIFGYSMGGYVALNLSTQMPERIGKIFTLGTKFQWTLDYAMRETKRLDPEKIREKVPDFAAELRNRHTAFGWENVLAQTAQMMKGLGNKNILTEEALKTIPGPACIGLGDRDNTVEIEEAAGVYRLLQSGSLMIFPSTPHPLERVNKGLLTQALTSYLGK